MSAEACKWLTLQEAAATICAIVIVLQQLAATVCAIIIVLQQLAATVGAIIIILQQLAACTSDDCQPHSLNCAIAKSYAPPTGPLQVHPMDVKSTGQHNLDVALHLIVSEQGRPGQACPCATEKTAKPASMHTVDLAGEVEWAVRNE